MLQELKGTGSSSSGDDDDSNSNDRGQLKCMYMDTKTS